MIDVTVSLTERGGAIRALHGVNNGPIGYGGLVDVSHHYRALGVPYARLHDPNWPHPREVDVPQIFPHFAADADDPASYDFARTDDYLQRILATGAQIIYRLGVSIEHTPRKYFTHPPADFDQWARVCCHIVRHYNQGWANGFHHGIRYWEIWNEPDLGERMWSGTPEQYLDLYARTATALRALDPSLKIGGPGAVSWRADLVTKLLERCRRENLPLDFLSWHAYRRSPGQIAVEAAAARRLLDEHGFTKTESHLNEWNYVDFDWGQVWQPGNEQMRRAAFQRQKNDVGASFAAAALIAMQDSSVDVGYDYDGQPSALFCGLFDYYGVPQKTFHAFRAFHELRAHATQVRTLVTGVPAGAEVFALAGLDGSAQQAALLVSYFGAAPSELRLAVRGASPAALATAQVDMLDSDHDLTTLPTATPDDAGALRVALAGHAVVLARWRLAGH